VGASNTMSSA